LNRGATQCRFVANKISPSTEGHNSLIRVQNSISVGQPHLYKNFWFGVDVVPRSSTMLFGYFPDFNPNWTGLEYLRPFNMLVTRRPILYLELGSSKNLSEGSYEKLCKLAHDIETCWDPEEAEEADGAHEVVRLLTIDPQYQRLPLYFRYRTLMPMAPADFATTISNSFQSYCDHCNRSGSSFERKMFSIALDLVVESSKDETGVQWMWWDQNHRKDHWCWTLVQDRVLDERFMNMYLLPLWVHCIDMEGTEFVFRRAKLELLYESWKQWLAPRSSYIPLM